MAQDTHDNADHSKRTILLVEDEAMLRDPLRKILERAGFSVHVAKDSGEALRIASEYLDRIDLLVSDVRMPGMTGPELATLLRSSHPELRVLLVSASPQYTVALDPGWSFLQKPFQLKVIIDKVHEILSGLPS